MATYATKLNLTNIPSNIIFIIDIQNNFKETIYYYAIH